MRALRGPALALILVGALGGREARADVPPESDPMLEPPTEVGAPEPPTVWRPQTSVLVTGAIVFGAGYVPAVGAALPATGGLLFRVAVTVLTIGLGAIVCSLGYGSDSYYCHGAHGGMELLLPVAGPFIFAADHPRDSTINPHGLPLGKTSKTLLYASGATQAAGLFTMGLGLVLGSRQPVGPAKTAAGRPELRLVPIASPSALGASAVVVW
jgi:hypothetical protein